MINPVRREEERYVERLVLFAGSFWMPEHSPLSKLSAQGSGLSRGSHPIEGPILEATLPLTNIVFAVP